MSKEWQEATNERAIEQKLNPISGASLGTLFVGLSLFRYSRVSRFSHWAFNCPPHPSVSLLSLAIFGP